MTISRSSSRNNVSFLILFLCLVSTPAAFSQNNPSVPNDIAATESHDGGLEVINLQNLSVGINAPVRSRAGFSYTLSGNSDCELSSNDSKIVCGINVGTKQDSGGWVVLTGIVNQLLGQYNPYVPHPYVNTTCTNTSNGTSNAYKYTLSGVYDAFVTFHTISPPIYFITAQAGQTPCKVPNTFQFSTTDGSGLTVVGTEDSTVGFTYTVYASSGNRFDSTAQVSNVFTDTNGNTISGTPYPYGSGTTTYTDYLGSSYSPLSVTGDLYRSGTLTWKDVNGTNQNVVESIASKTLATDFGCSNPHAAWSDNVLTQITYPDNSTLKF